MKISLPIAVLLLFGSWLQAKERQEIFPAPCEKVWQAALEVAGEHYEAVRPLKSDWTPLFDVGTFVLTGEKTVTVRFVPKDGEACEVRASGHSRGFANRDTKTFLDRLGKKLKEPGDRDPREKGNPPK
jgi:hypothetical protein